MTKINWDRADEYPIDPGAVRGNSRGHLSQTEAAQLVIIYERHGRAAEEKQARGETLNKYEQRELERWRRLKAQAGV